MREFDSVMNMRGFCSVWCRLLGVVMVSGCFAEVGPVSIQLLPEDPYHFDSLRVEILSSAMGPDGKPVTNYEYTWYRDNQKIGTLTGATVDAPPYDDLRDDVDWMIADGEVWTVDVVPVSASGLRGPVSRDSVTVNRRPTVEIDIQSYDPAEGQSSAQTFAGNSAFSLLMSVDVRDPDSDAEETGDTGSDEPNESADPSPEYEVLWERFDEESAGYVTLFPANPLVIPSTDLSREDHLRVTVTPFTPLSGGYAEPRAYGAPVIEDLYFENQLPYFTRNPTIIVSGDGDGDGDVSTAAANDELLCDYALRDFEEDAISAVVAWEDDSGNLLAEDSESLVGAFVRSDTVLCRVYPSDDLGPGIALSSTPITIQNAVPVATAVSILSTTDADYDADVTTATVGDIIECNYTADDVDGDSVVQSDVEWFNGATALSGSDSVLELVPSEFSVGDFVTCQVTLWDADGLANGLSGEAASVQLELTPIQNIPPVVENVAIDPNPPSVGDTLTCHYDYSDAEGEEDQSTISWSVNGAEITEVPWIHVSSNERAACAVDQQGYAQCWGRVVTPSGADIEPVPDEHFSKVEVGADFACGITWNGEIRCWGPDEFGSADFGQVRNAPSGAGFSDLALGLKHACALDSANEAVCWGDNSFEQYESVPSGPFQALSAAWNGTCGLDLDGGITCWGTGLEDLEADLAASDEAFVSFSASFQGVCALNEVGEITCFSNASVLEDVIDQMPTGSGYLRVSLGETEACAINASSELDCWGNDLGGLIAGAPTGAGFADVRVGQFGACAVRQAGEVVCWGDDAPKLENEAPVGLAAPTETLSGLFELGDEVQCSVTPSDGVSVQSEIASKSYVVANTLPSVSDVVVSPDNPGDAEDLECVYTFRDADGDSDNSVVSWMIDGLPFEGYEWVSGEGGENHHCLLNEVGQVYCWGEPSYFGSWPGEGYRALGVGAYSTCGVDGLGRVDCQGTVKSLSDDAPVDEVFVNVSVSRNAACGLSEIGEILCWGDSGISEIVNNAPSGDGFMDVSLSDWVDVGCAVREAGDIVCWGTQKDLTDLVDDSTFPLPIDAMFTAVSINGWSGCALTDSGEVVCFGDNMQFSDIPTDSGFVQVSVGRNRACALHSDNTLACWGGDLFGGVSLTPTDANYRYVFTSDDATTAIDLAGQLVSWGDDIEPPTELLTNSTILTSDYADLGEEVTCTVTAYDGVGYGGASSSEPVTVVNTAPTVTNVRISPDPAGESSTLTCTYVFDDLDGDADQSELIWSVNGVDLANNSDGDGDPSTLLGGFIGGDVVECEVNSFDGLDEGTTRRDSVEINSAPIVTNVRVESTTDADGDDDPLTVVKEDSLVCLYDFADVDGDSDLSTIVWNINGTQAATGASLSVGLANHDVVSCAVTPDDGIDVLGELVSPTVAVSGVKEISAGYSFSCLLSPYGNVACWGDNSFGQTDAPAGHFRSVGAGAYHACALTTQGEVQCWGLNDGGADDFGQVADTPDSSNTYEFLAVGPYANCAIAADGSTVCWGDDGADIVSEVPTSDFVQVDVSDRHACGLSGAGTVECWGDNAFDQLNVAGFSAIVDVAVGVDHTCVVDDLGEASCVGWNREGQCDVPTSEAYVSVEGSEEYTCGITLENSISCWGVSSGNGSFEKVSGAPTSGIYRRVSTGNHHACAIAEDGRPECWGGVGAAFADLTVILPFEDRDLDGEIGLYDCDDENDEATYLDDDADCDGATSLDDCDDLDASVGDINDDQDCDGVPSVEDCDDNDVTLGDMADDADCDGLLADEDCDDSDPDSTAVALDADCDGFESTSDCDDSNPRAAELTDDQDCDGVQTDLDCDDSDPSSELECVSVGLGMHHGCIARSTGGPVTCWGVQSGVGDDFGQVQKTPSGQDFVHVDAGLYHSCAIDNAGELHCWGIDTGSSPDEGQVTEAPTTGTFLQTASGANHGCALATNGTIECWGDDTIHLVSDSATGSEPYTFIASGVYQSCALNAVGGVSCWGDIPLAHISFPTASVSDFVTLTIGKCHACGLETNGALSCWGNEAGSTTQWDFGQVSSAPSSGTFLSVAAGHYHSCAVTTLGAVQCWGIDDGSNDDYGQVTDAPALGHYVEVFAGPFNTCALRRDGELVCWGLNNKGQSNPACWGDADCDGVPTTSDCEDTDASNTRDDDCDEDGVSSLDDCDDDDSSNTRTDDCDQDGVATADDCDDADISLGAVLLDADCDGVLTVDDCDDTDPDNAATDDCDEDGVLAVDDCDDFDSSLGDIGLDQDCDGILDPTWPAVGSLATADYTLIGENPGDKAGELVASAGDVDGDGLADVLVVTRNYDVSGSRAARVYLVLGSSLAATQTIDLSAADYIFVGTERGDAADYSVAGVGDVDADGLDDLLIGAPKNSDSATYAGKAYLILGSSLAGTSTINLVDADVIFEGQAASDLFGWSVAGAGDVDGDGLADLLFGAPEADGAVADAGRAYLVLGANLADSPSVGSASADFKFLGENMYDQAGASVAGVGDVDGDGLDDILIGATNADDVENGVGKSYLVFGSSLGSSSSINLASADHIFVGENAQDQAGEYVAGAGDVDGDGLSDLLIGSQGNDDGGTLAGKVYIIAASSLGALQFIDLAQATYSFVGTTDFSYLGLGISSAGDVDGDGRSDILMGSFSHNDGTGITYLILGASLSGTSGFDLSQADYSFVGEFQADFAGGSFSSAGDVNGDGLDDLIIGAHGNGGASNENGKAYVLLSLHHPDDGDGDGVVSAYDCDDGDPLLGRLDHDADCDGVEYYLDCDDTDAQIGSACGDIEIEGDARRWTDGTYAAGCWEYRASGDPNHTYTGDVGDGVYTVEPLSGTVFDVYCDMTTDGGGWTLVDNDAVSNLEITGRSAGAITDPQQTGGALLPAYAWSGVPKLMCVSDVYSGTEPWVSFTVDTGTDAANYPTSVASGGALFTVHQLNGNPDYGSNADFQDVDGRVGTLWIGDLGGQATCACGYTHADISGTINGLGWTSGLGINGATSTCSTWVR